MRGVGEELAAQGGFFELVGHCARTVLWQKLGRKLVGGQAGKVAADTAVEYVVDERCRGVQVALWVIQTGV